MTPNTLNYTISLEQGLPAFYIKTEATTADPDATYNNDKYFDFKFSYLTSDSVIFTNYTALPCS